MRPWERSWRALERHDGLGHVIDDKGTGVCGVEDPAAAKLIASAPEMARLLIDIRGAELVPGGMEERIRAVLKKAGVPDHT